MCDKMKEISYSGKTIDIGGDDVQLDEKITDVITAQGKIFVLHEYDEGSPPYRNLLSFDDTGSRLWRIEPLKKDDDSHDAPITMAKWIDNDDMGAHLRVYDRRHRYWRVDLNTGDVEYLGWFR